MDLLLVRHGKTDWNETPRVMGHQPIPLNEEGRGQAALLNQWLQKIPLDAVYSSPVARAMETAQKIVEGREGLRVVVEKGVEEIDYGQWVGLSFEEVALKYSKEYQTYFKKPSRVKIPGGESVAAVQRRAVGAIEKIRKQHAGERVLVVSHADVIKAVLVYYLGLPLDAMQRIASDNGSLAMLSFGTEWGDRLVALNYFADVKKILPW